MQHSSALKKARFACGAEDITSKRVPAQNPDAMFWDRCNLHEDTCVDALTKTEPVDSVRALNVGG